MAKYDITWQRPNNQEIFTCKDLSDRDLVRRLIGAIETNGSVLIHKVKRVHTRFELRTYHFKAGFWTVDVYEGDKLVGIIGPHRGSASALRIAKKWYNNK